MCTALSVVAKQSPRHALPSSTCFFGLLVAYIDSQHGRCTALKDNVLGGRAWHSSVRDRKKRLLGHGDPTAMHLCCEDGSRESGQTYETILGISEYVSFWPDVRLCQ
jgi:hypothetical protein